MKAVRGSILFLVVAIVFLASPAGLGAQTPTINAGGVVSGASFAPSPEPVAAGSIVSVFGSSFASGTGGAVALPLPTDINGTQLLINGIAAPLFFVSPTQINAQVAWEVASSGTLNVQVVFNGVQSNTVVVNEANSAPGLFATNQAGSGQGAILIANTGGIVAAPTGMFTNSRPVRTGEFLEIFCTGLGPVTNTPATGDASTGSPLSETLTTPTVTLGGAPLTVSFSGLAPGFVGLYQVNVQIPSDAPVGDGVPLVIETSSGFSNSVSIAIESTLSLSSRVSLTSASPSSVSSFATLTINGSGFEPYASGLSVILRPLSLGEPIVVPVMAASTDRVEVIIPPLFDSSGTLLTSDTMDVQVVQVTDSLTMTSNILSGIQFTGTAVGSRGVTPGRITRAFIESGLNVMTTSESAMASLPNRGALLSAMSTARTAQTNLMSQVDSIISNSSQTFNLPTTDGQPLILDSSTLAVSDELIFQLIQQFSSQVLEAPTSNLSRDLALSACIPNTGDPSTDSFICKKQAYSEQLSSTGREAVALGAKIEMGFYLSALGGWAAAGLSQAGAVAPSTANAFQLVWSTASSYIAAYATRTTPPADSETLMNVGAQILEQQARSGLPVLSGTLFGFNVYKEATKVARRAISESPQNGVLLNGNNAGIPIGEQAVNVYQGTEPSTTVTRIGVPSAQQTTETSTAADPEPPVTQFDGSYLGNFSGTTFFDDGSTQPESGPVALGVSNGALSVTQPGIGSGTVSQSGRILTGSVVVNGVPCTFGGRFFVQTDGTVTASGSWSCTFAGGSSQGSWSASR